MLISLSQDNLAMSSVMFPEKKPNYLDLPQAQNFPYVVWNIKNQLFVLLSVIILDTWF